MKISRVDLISYLGWIYSCLKARRAQTLQTQMTSIDAKVNAAYADVRNDNCTTNWMVVQYESEKSDALFLGATGTRD